MRKPACILALIVGLFCMEIFPLWAEDASPKPLVLENVLKNWHARISQYQGIQARFQRTIYHHVHKLRLQTESSVILTRDDIGRYGSETLPLNEKFKSNGLFMDLEERTKGYDRKNIPLIRHDPPNSFFTPLDFIELQFTYRFLLGVPPEEFQERYEISLERESELQVGLKFLPKYEYDEKQFSEVVLILYLETYLPSALKLVDPKKRKETLYLFENVKESTLLRPIPHPERWNLSAWNRRLK